MAGMKMFSAVCMIALIAMSSVKAQEDCLSIAETAVAANLTTLVAAVSSAGLIDFLSNKTLAVTVLAPTDEAFANLLTTLDISAEELLSSDLLTDVLNYHIIPAVAFAADLTDGATLPTQNGETLNASLADGVTFEGVGSSASVVFADVPACDSVIHVIDDVLLPIPLLTQEPGPPEVDTPAVEEPAPAECLSIAETAVAANLTTLVAAVTAAGLADFLSDKSQTLTVLAPTDEAFAELLATLGATPDELLSNTDLLTSVLTYHVIDFPVFAADLVDGAEVSTSSGASLTVDLSDGVTFQGIGSSANVVTPDVTACDSVIHVIDSVLLPIPVPTPEEPTPEEDPDFVDDSIPADQDPAECLSIAETAVAANLTTLVAAVTAAGLADFLSDKSQTLTVLAPTDEAFAELLATLGATPDELLSNTDLLTSVLTYHVIDSPVFAADLVDGAEVPTENGASLTVSLADGVTFQGIGSSANVVTPDVTACESVIHVIDSVLLPIPVPSPEEPTPEEPVPAECLSIAETAVAANLTTLVAAVTAAGLADFLSDKSQTLTVLAPTDEAFAELLATLGATPDELLSNTDLLTSVLTYHVIETPVFAADLVDGAEVPTSNGESLTVDLSDGVSFIGVGSTASVVSADVTACDSVIHVIDAVLLPEPSDDSEGAGAFSPCTVGADCASGVCFGDFQSSFFFLFEAFRTCSP